MKLAYIAPGPLEPKANSALEEFAQYWEGEVVAVSQPHGIKPNGYSVVVADDFLAAARALRPDLIIALMRPEYFELCTIAPTVLTAEANARIRAGIQLSDSDRSVEQWRIRIGQLRLDRVYKALARTARGLQCNGPEAYRSYAHLSPSPIGFQDHRIRASDLELAWHRDVWKGDRPLRAAFSGRLIRAKGADLLIDIARYTPNIHFDVLGAGDLRASLDRLTPRNVTIVGRLPFDEWKAYMRANVDVAVLPHRQGDPSCTYFEALGCGVPVVASANATWKYYARHGLGWAERDASRIAARLASLTPADLDSSRQRGLGAVRPFEEVARRRVAHLRAVAERSER